ncbi:RNA-directed DNA polymerase from mobile element jockey [Trichonephila clavipes]|nr:RNA-directed DNA polymerase from mobile element jockey [Trichonephila clavipes]
MDDLSPRPSSSGSLRGASARFMTSFISWNCRGLRTRLADLKSIISTYQPACVALQGDISEEYHDNTIMSSHCTSLQAVAVRIHIHSLVTVCCVYLPPNDVVPQVDLNRLVSQLPAPFLLLGDFNGHSPLWGMMLQILAGDRLNS